MGIIPNSFISKYAILVITDTGTSILKTVRHGDLLSDQSFVDVTLKFPHKAQQRTQLSARKV